MTSVGILTIHNIFNYGSILQAYATKSILNEIGFDAEIINYSYPSHAHNYENSIFHKWRSSILREVNVFLKKTLPGNPYRRYRSRYEEARNCWLEPTTQEYHSPSQIQISPPTFDQYLVGSDQVWHPRSIAFDSTFFGSFVPEKKKKFSYASSFGTVSLPDCMKEYYIENLGSFDHLSVREQSGANLVESLLGYKPEVVLDPTLMLDSGRWSQDMVEPNLSERYIVCYGFNPSSKYMEELSLKIAKKRNLPLIRINGNFFDYFSRKMHYIIDAGPREWLGLLYNAELIVAQSFHGTAFAVNFGVPFFSLLRGDASHDFRQSEFLTGLGLQHRLVRAGDDIDKIILTEADCDFSYASSLLEKKRMMSFKFMMQALYS